MPEFVTLGLSEIAFARWGAAPPPSPPKPAITPGPTNVIVMSNVDASPDEYKPDLTYQNLVPLAVEISPITLTEYRRRARFGDPRWLFAFYDESLRVGVNVQHTKVITRMRSARAIFHTFPEDLESEEYDEGFKPEPVEGAPVARLGPHKKAIDVKLAADARDAAKYVEQQLKPWLPQILEAAAEAHAYGLSGVWLKVEPGGSEDGLDQITAVSYVEPRRLRIDQPRNKLQIQLDPKASSFVDADEYIKTGQLVIFDVAPTKSLDQKGLFWQSIIPWAQYQYGNRWWAKFLELFGIPFRSATYEGNTPKARKEVEEVLAKAGASGWAALPAGTTIQFASAVAGESGSPHERWADFLVGTLDQIWLGHNQASGVQSDAGSQQSNDAAKSGANELHDARLAMSATWITDQISRPLVARNKSPKLAKFHCPTIELKVNSNEDVLTLSTITGQAVLFGAGELIDAADVVSRLGLKLARKGKKNLKAPEPPAPPAGAPGEPRKPGEPPKPGQPKPGEPVPPKPGQPKSAVQPKPGKGAPPPKKKGKFGEVSSTEELLRKLETRALESVAGSGDPIVGSYALVISEARRDGVDLAQLFARIKREAELRGSGEEEVGQHLAAIYAEAFFEGYEHASENEFSDEEDVEDFMAQGQPRAPKGRADGGEWVKKGASPGSVGREGRARAGKYVVSAKGVKVDATKSARAKAAHRGGSKEAQRHGEAMEPLVAKLLGGAALPDNEAFDVVLTPDGRYAGGHLPDRGKPVLKGRHYLEIKAMSENGNGKVTIKGEPLARKRNTAKDEHAVPHLLVVDDRAIGFKEGRRRTDLFTKGRTLYYVRGVGSVRIGSKNVTAVRNRKHLLRLMSDKSLTEIRGRG